MEAALGAEQEDALKSFMNAVSDSGASVITRTTALKFLFARKFDVQRALTLWRQHDSTRRREGLDNLDPFAEPLKSELATGKFTVLATRDNNGAAIAVFTARKHMPSESTHQTTLQGLVFQLDAALQSQETQKAGLVFIYDMTDSKYTNFDYDLSQKILTMLKGGYPAKLKKVLIVTAPLWFKAPFRILRLFVREKLRERVHTVSAPQLAAHVPRNALPRALAGLAQHDHQAWLLNCLKLFASGYNGVQRVDNNISLSTYIVNPVDTVKQNGVNHNGPNDVMLMNSENNAIRRDNSASPCKQQPHSGDESDLDISASHPFGSRGAWSSDASSDSEPCGNTGVTPSGLLRSLRSKGRRGLASEYAEIRSQPPTGTFNHARLAANLPKNRYTDVLCYDHSRVILSCDPSDPHGDYINANYVDGYRQKNAFISTQGPLPKTYADFWRMVWEQHSLVIVMTTKTTENGRVKCGQYWPLTASQSVRHGDFEVTTQQLQTNEDYIVTELTLTNLQTSEWRPVSHWQYVRWPDYGVPGRAAPVLAFLQGVRQAQSDALQRLGDAWAGHNRGPPIIVHCSAGIGRTGTFLTLDISISRLEATGKVDVRGTVERIRSQRAHSIQTPEQYIFCHLALVEYALMHNHLDSADLTGFDDDQE